MPLVRSQPRTPLLAGDGTAGAPAYSFASDPDMGVFRTGSDELGFAAAGALRAFVRSTGVRLNVDGNAAAPSLSHVSQLSTGLFWPTANVLGLAAGGVEHLRGNTSGQNLAPDGTAALPSLSFASDPDTGVYRPLSNQMNLVTGGSTKAYVSAIGLSVLFGLWPPTPTGVAQTAGRLFMVTGAPADINGSDGDICFRSDGGALTTIYQKRAGVWVGVA